MLCCLMCPFGQLCNEAPVFSPDCASTHIQETDEDCEILCNAMHRTLLYAVVQLLYCENDAN